MGRAMPGMYTAPRRVFGSRNGSSEASGQNRLESVTARMAQQQRTEQISPQKWKEASDVRPSNGKL